MTAEKFIREIQSTAELFFKSIAVDIYQDAGILCIVTGIDNNFLNTVLHVNVGEDQLEERIYMARIFFSSHQVPWTWCVNPLDQPGNIGYLLKSHGFVGLESAPVMVCDLKNYSPTKSRLSIKEVSSPHDFQDWGKALLEGFQSLLKIAPNLLLSTKTFVQKKLIFIISLLIMRMSLYHQ